MPSKYSAVKYLSIDQADEQYDFIANTALGIQIITADFKKRTKVIFFFKRLMGQGCC
jgi:peroxiredoxin